jgi:hypothetical protein
MGLYAPDVGSRDLGQETRDTLQAEIDLAPQRYAAEAQYGPQYTQLGLQSLQDTLLGTGGNRGLLDIYSTDIAPRMGDLERQSQAAQRAADIAAVEQFGPRATEAMRAVNPQQTALLDAITQQSLGDIQSGYNLPAGLRNTVNQATRAGQAARGLGFGPSDAYAETLAQSDVANQWRGQNLDRGMRVAATNAATQTDPFLAILGRPASSPAAAQGLLGSLQGQSGQAAGRVANQFDPFSGYAQDLYNTNYNAQAASKIGGANALAGIASSAVGSL